MASDKTTIDTERTVRHKVTLQFPSEEIMLAICPALAEVYARGEGIEYEELVVSIDGGDAEVIALLVDGLPTRGSKADYGELGYPLVNVVDIRGWKKVNTPLTFAILGAVSMVAVGGLSAQFLSKRSEGR